MKNEPTLTALALVATLLTGCVDTRDAARRARPLELPAAPRSAEERLASDTLSERTAAPWTVRQDRALRTVSFAAPARGTGPRVTGADTGAATLAFIDRHRDVFAVRRPADELVVKETRIDELSMKHIRLGQVQRGLEVVGADLAVHYDASDRIMSIHQRYVPNLDRLDLTPAISAADATARIRTFAAYANEVVTVTREPKLVVFARRGFANLAWQTTILAGRHGWTVHVDASTGTVLDRLAHEHTLEGFGLGIDGTRRKVQYSRESGANLLFDATRPASIRLFDGHGSPNYLEQATAVSSSLPESSWDAAPSLAPGAAVDAAVWIGHTADFYATNFGRKGWDDANGLMQVIVHVGDGNGPSFANAFYSSTDNVVAVGDGDDTFGSYAAPLDVMAHEYSHAVTHFSSGLVYQDQSGALNESFSDIMGNAVEHAVRPDPDANWLMGEGMVRATGGPSRNLRDPHDESSFFPQPAHLSEYIQTTEDSGGVHSNSGIPNHAAYLMTMGGTNSVSKVTVSGGIGWDNLAKVFYRANTVYLNPSSDFAAAAEATLQAAVDLGLSEADIATIDCAWKAVGVADGDCVTIQTEAAENPPATPDATATDVDSDGDTTLPEKSSEARKKAKARAAQPAAADRGCSAGGRVEPSTPWLLVLAGLVVVARSRRRR